MNSNQKIAFITGANRGIGLETARGLGKLGIRVVLGVRDTEKGAAVAERLRGEGIAAEAVHFDAEDAQGFAAIHRHLEANYGKLDILVNNAGIAREPLFGNNSSTVGQDVLKATFETNFFAVIALTQTLLPLIRKATAGRIVNLSSILGSLAMHSAADSPVAGAKSLAYDASKTALNAFTVHLAHELRDTPIKVNSAHPGWVKTDMGGPEAPLDVTAGSQTSIALATLPADGPSGGFFHLGQALPW